MAIELTTATQAELSGIKSIISVDTAQLAFPLGKFGHTGSGGMVQCTESGNLLSFEAFEKFTVVAVAQLLRAGSASGITTITGVNKLSSLENAGTLNSLQIGTMGLSESQLNQIFTDLPSTTKTATINVAGNPGAVTCDTTIATNKGYTVVT